MTESLARMAALGLMLAVLASSVHTCAGGSYSYPVNDRGPSLAGAGAGLDLAAVGELVRSSSTASDLEKALNDPSRGVNNLDLDQNGQVDYLKVREFGDGSSRGFLLTAELAGDQSLEVASIDVEKVSDTEGRLEVQGDRTLYGERRYYSSGFSFTDYLLLGWLFSSRPGYLSPWSYGTYPPSYRPYSTVPRSVYQSKSADLRQRSRLRAQSQSGLSDRYRSTASASKASLRRPLTSQRAFSTRAGQSARRSGGFGSARPSGRSTRSGFGSRSRGFGGFGK